MDQRIILFGPEKPGTPEELVDDLIHFGIKGMKWGVRKQEETSDRSPGRIKRTASAIGKKNEQRKENNAKEHDVQAAVAQKRIDLIRANPSKWRYVQRQRNAQIRELEKHRDQNLKDAKDIREGRLTDHQKKVLIGAGVAVGILAAYGTYRFVDSGSARQLLNRNKPFKPNDMLSQKKTPFHILEDVVKPINPGYGDMGTKVNCRRCTYAYEMRRRGFDVKATNTVTGRGQTIAGNINATTPGSNLPTGPFGITRTMLKEAMSEKGTGPLTEAAKRGAGMGRDEIDFGSRWLTDSKGVTQRVDRDSLGKTQSVFQTILRHGEGSRGELGVVWRGGGAHSMAWEVIDGQPHIFDTQTAKHYNLEAFHRAFGGNITKAGITRLDNLTLNEDYLKKWVFNVK